MAMAVPMAWCKRPAFGVFVHLSRQTGGCRAALPLMHVIVAKRPAT
jgi:hypothetical protein